MKATRNGVDITSAAKLCGLSQGVLRIWELRYGWPAPWREANGYRVYSRALVEDLIRFGDLIRRGWNPGDLIVDGFPKWPPYLDPKPKGEYHAAPVETPVETREPDLSAMFAIRAPENEVAAHYLTKIRLAIRGRLEGHLELLLIEAACRLRPDHRAAFAWLPALIGLDAWDRFGRPLRFASDMRDFIRDQVGAVGWSGLMEHVGQGGA